MSFTHLSNSCSLIAVATLLLQPHLLTKAESYRDSPSTSPPTSLRANCSSFISPPQRCRREKPVTAMATATATAMAKPHKILRSQSSATNTKGDVLTHSRLRNVNLPPKLKCHYCNKSYNQASFSKKQLQDSDQMPSRNVSAFSPFSHTGSSTFLVL